MVLEEKIITLLVVAAIVAILAHRWKLPYTVALVVTGLVLGALEVEPGLHLSRELVFAVFLPALLFEAAFHLDISRFRRNAGPILVLAVIGVAFSIVITGALTWVGLSRVLGVEGLGVLSALLFGALISATDPISVMAVFKKLGVPARLNLVVEGESLFNDGTAVVIFTLILAAVGASGHEAATQDVGILWAVQEFIKEVFGGLAVGLVLGLAVSYLTAQVEDHLIEILLTTVLAYGVYLISEHLHVSGVIGVVAAGMMSGNYGGRVGMSPSTKMAVVTFWEYAAFVVNSIIFLLIGMDVNLPMLKAHAWHIAVAWVSVTLARAVAVNLLFPVINRFFNGLPWKWSPVMVWGGLRGSISMALAMSLPLDLPYRETILAMTFGVVIISILGQALTMRPLLNLLGIVGEGGKEEYGKARADLKATRSALDDLEELKREGAVSAGVYEKLEKELKDRLSGISDRIAELHESDKKLHEEEYRAVRKRLLLAEKESLRESFQIGTISDDDLKELVRVIDAEYYRLEEEDA